MENMNKTGNGSAKWKQVSKHKYLAWVPGSDVMWKAHTEELVRERFREELIREMA